MIGNDVEVFVVDVRADKVRLGIAAPKSVTVHRKEVYDAIRRENRTLQQSGDFQSADGVLSIPASPVKEPA